MPDKSFGPIRILKKHELEGTAYIEILPGPYQNECWSDRSLFFEEEVFGLIEPVFEKIADFDHYSFSVIEEKFGFKY